MLPPEVILLLLLSGDAVQEEEATAPPLDPEPEYVDTTEPFPRDRVLIYDGRDICYVDMGMPGKDVGSNQIQAISVEATPCGELVFSGFDMGNGRYQPSLFE